ncbi:hypothetical protein M9Y10_043311 [Tritrichomonas musculus]|uniref:Uncharacterized protein n=1 Tax=Tritrichomonas musculus TaxID=1915356 RepID=A0ABR2JZA8_9EUKA
MTNDQTVLFSFDIGLDGKIIPNNDTSNIPDQEFVIDSQIIHRLLFSAQKALIDEEVVAITATTDKYMLKISYTDGNFTGQVIALPPKTNNEPS